MDAHRELIMQIHNKTEVLIGNRKYCYNTIDAKSCIELEVDPSEVDALKELNEIEVEDFIFKKLDKTRTLQNGDIEIVYSYEINPKKDYTDKIDTGTKKYGVICPEGKFYECSYAGHSNLEFWLTQRGLLKEVKGYGTDSYEMEGWVKLSGATMSTVEACFQEEVTEYDFQEKKDKLIVSHKITKQQVNTLVTYIKNLGREMINYNYRWYHIDDFKLILITPLNKYEFQDKYGTYKIEEGNAELNKQRR